MSGPNWDESKHPRWPAGTSQGGQFAPKDAVPNWDGSGYQVPLPMGLPTQERKKTPEEFAQQEELYDSQRRRVMQKKYEEAVNGQELYRNLWPELNSERILEDRNGLYNCVADALGDNRRWWWPGEYWPEAFNFGETVQSFDALIESFGGKNLGWAGEKENSSDVLLALFTIDGTDEGEPTHLMRQLSNGKWRTKMGPDWTLQIDDIGELAGGDYGDVAQFYSVPKDMWDQFRDYEE